MRHIATQIEQLDQTPSFFKFYKIKFLFNVIIH